MGVTEIKSQPEWDDLHKQVKNSEIKAVVVDFSATWCGPCRMISPYFEKLSDEYPTLKFVKVDVDAVEPVAAICGISAMPTFQVWVDGKKEEELVGAAKDKLKAMIEKYA